MSEMTGPEYKLAIACLRLNQREAADFLGIALRTSQDYATKGGVPTPSAKLLRLMVARRIDPDEVQ